MRSLGTPGAMPVAGCRQCGSVSVTGPTPAGGLYDEGYYLASYLPFEDRRRHFVRQLLLRLGPGSNQVLVDAGCGVGFALLEARGAGWVPLGVEVAPSGAALARRRGLAVARSTAEALPVRDGRAGAVVLLDVLAHLGDPRSAVHEAVRVVRPGGQVLVKTPNRPAWAYALARRLPRPAARSLLHLPHQQHALSRRGLAALLVGAGLEEVSVLRSREPVPLRERMGGSWRSRAGAMGRALVEVAYGRPSTVAVGRRPRSLT